MANNLESAMEARLLAALSSTEFACSSLESLSGGSVNFTFRGKLEKPFEGATSVVVRHSEDYLARNENFKLDIERCQYEIAMLEALNDEPPTVYNNVRVKSPRVIDSNTIMTNTLILEDLKSGMSSALWFREHGHDIQESQARSLGFAIGLWLIRLHQWGMKDSPKTNELRARIAGNQGMKDLKWRINMGRYQTAIDKFPQLNWEEPEVYQEITRALKQLLTQDEKSLIHGDFWGGNILLKDGPLPSEDNIDVFIVDYELSQIGSCSQDLGQCFAELWLLLHFHKIKAAGDMIIAISEGYCYERKEGKDNTLAFQVAMHMGIHLAVFPWNVGWGDGELSQECVQFGNDCLVKGYRRDRDWFRGGLLDALFAD